jgi:hypothetical protein
MSEPLIIGLIAGLQSLLLITFQVLFSGEMKRRFDIETEKLKKHFSEELSVLQADLAKQNITHQVKTSEFTKLKFQKLAQLHKVIIDEFKHLYNSITHDENLTSDTLKVLSNVVDSDYQTFQSLIWESEPFFDKQTKDKLLIFATLCRAYRILSIDNLKYFRDKYYSDENPIVQDEDGSYYENLPQLIEETSEKLKDANNQLQRSFPELTQAIVQLLN